MNWQTILSITSILAICSAFIVLTLTLSLRAIYYTFTIKVDPIKAITPPKPKIVKSIQQQIYDRRMEHEKAQGLLRNKA